MRLLGGLLLAITAWAQTPPLALHFLADVKPILQKHGYSCHGALRQKSGLRLDHVTFIRQGGDRGEAIAANPAESLLLRALEGTDDLERMPLDAKPLSEAEIATLKAWIE